MKLTFDNYKDILNKFNTFNEHDIGLVESLLKDAYEYSKNYKILQSAFLKNKIDKVSFQKYSE